MIGALGWVRDGADALAFDGARSWPWRPNVSPNRFTSSVRACCDDRQSGVRSRFRDGHDKRRWRIEPVEQMVKPEAKNDQDDGRPTGRLNVVAAEEAAASVHVSSLPLQLK